MIVSCQHMIRLSPASEKDFDFLFNLKKSSYKTILEKMGWWDDNEQRKYLFKTIPIKKTKIIIWNGKKVGCLTVSERRRDMAYETLYIDPQYQGLGIGSYVTQMLIERSKKIRKPLVFQVLKYPLLMTKLKILMNQHFN